MDNLWNILTFGNYKQILNQRDELLKRSNEESHKEYDDYQKQKNYEEKLEKIFDDGYKLNEGERKYLFDDLYICKHNGIVRKPYKIQPQTYNIYNDNVSDYTNINKDVFRVKMGMANCRTYLHRILTIYPKEHPLYDPNYKEHLNELNYKVNTKINNLGKIIEGFDGESPDSYPYWCYGTH